MRSDRPSEKEFQIDGVCFFPAGHCTSQYCAVFKKLGWGRHAALSEGQ